MKKNSIPKLELVFLLLLTGMCPQAHATDDGRNASPQKTYAVDLTLGSATVLTFTEAVTSQTGVLFSYESALSQMPLGDVSVHETAAPLEHILEKVFKGRGFRYKVVDRIVVLTYDTDSARSQLVLVTGRVKDGSGMPLVGASVVVKDTMRGVSAGAEGNYRIFADPDATLVFSYIGYADREERIGTRSAIDVVLEEYEAVLEDVVVVGYGTQSRRTVTAAISKFDGHLLEGIPVNSVGDALKGRVPGVRVATTDATPGADPKFLIRGGSSINQSNDPIVLVDGVVREMAGLNPNDIESVSFLKDAAAAGIYGSRASNGVILITTKKGSKHLGPRIVFEGQWAWASPATKFDLMNARDYILTVRPALMEGYCGGMDPASVLGGEQSAGTGNTARSLWTTRYLRPDEQVPAGYQWVEDPVNPGRIIVFEDNDQQSQWFGDACWQNYYVGIDGGGDNIQYAASAGYTDDSGIGVTTGYSRFTFHGNTTFQVTRRLRASTTFDYSQIEQQTFESAPLSLRNSVIRGLSVPNTHRDWYGEEAGEELAGTPALGTNNTTIPAAYYAYYYHNAGSTIKRSTATINLDWEVFDGLRLVGQFTNYNRHTRSYFYVEDNPTTGSNIRPMKEGFSETNRMDFQAYADYKGTFGNGHRLGAVAGYEYMLDKLNSFDVRVQGAVSDKLPVLDAGTSNIANYPKSTRTRECLISYFGRVNYDYGGRYLFAATMRIVEIRRRPPLGLFPGGIGRMGGQQGGVLAPKQCGQHAQGARELRADGQQRDRAVRHLRQLQLALHLQRQRDHHDQYDAQQRPNLGEDPPVQRRHRPRAAGQPHHAGARLLQQGDARPAVRRQPPQYDGLQLGFDQPGARQVLRHGAVSVVGQHRPQGFFVEDGFYVQLQHEPRARTARQRQSPQPHQRHLGR